VTAERHSKSRQNKKNPTTNIKTIAGFIHLLLKIMSGIQNTTQPCLKSDECNYDYCYVETIDKDVEAKGI
jgi:hypothetical protein